MTYYFVGQNGHVHILRVEGPDVGRGLVHISQYNLLKQVHLRQPLEVCSLNMLKQSGKCSSELEMLEALSKCDEPANLGGWRKADQDLICLEVANFNPAAALVGASNLKNRTFVKHPAVREGFIFPFPDGIPLSAMRLLRAIYDIRRFTDPTHCRKKYFLREHFHLTTPQLFFEMMKGQVKPDRGFVLAKTMLDAWYEQPLNQEEPFSEKFQSSRAFLFQRYHATVNEMSKNYNETRAIAYGLWKTTVMFCDFVQMIWQAGLGDREFDPVSFFDDEKITVEFCAFIKRIDKGLDISKPSDRDGFG